MSGAEMDLVESVPSFGAGTGMWALALALISSPAVFSAPVGRLGLVTAALFAATALRIFAGAEILPTASPMPFFVYPLFVATLIGWIVTIWRVDGGSASTTTDGRRATRRSDRGSRARARGTVVAKGLL